MNTFSREALYVLRFINQTNRSIFLTGKAGTGKTTLLKEIVSTTHKNTVVVAPTGIAALNAGGVTIHSFFQLPFATFVPDIKNPPIISEYLKIENRVSIRRQMRVNKLKKNIFQSMELLIVDEVSMLRADVLDAIDYILKTFRRNQKAFGGVQVLFIGDLLQLPPVVNNMEWEILKDYYEGNFFFHSKVIQSNPPIYVELEKIYRQSDQRFIEVLNNLRNNRVSREDVRVMNQFVKEDFDIKSNPGYITLTTHNQDADSMNAIALEALKTKRYSFYAEIVGDFQQKIYPIEYEMRLKEGAQIMFIKNDVSSEKNFFNGKMGIIRSLSENEIFVHFPEEDKTIELEKHEWQNVRYTLDPNTKEIKEEIIGTFTHYPIKLAWAITIHKSQGLTFDKAVLDVSRVFMPGQAYVALSRLRSLEGLILLSPIRMNGLQNDSDVMNYSNQKASKEELQDELEKETGIFLRDYLIQAYSWIDLSMQCKLHLHKYETESSSIIQFKSWAENQSQTINVLVIHSEKFVQQIKKIFQEENYDFYFVKERVNKAHQYFFEKIDAMVFELLYTIAKVKRIKNMKTFFQELLDLENSFIKTVFQMKKAQLLLDTLEEGKTICKDTLSDMSFGDYKKNHLLKIANILKDSNIFQEEVEDLSYYKEKKVKKKEPKKHTAIITFELWKEGKQVEEIAELRKLTHGTIYTHLARLVKEKKIEISEVLNEEKLAELEKTIKGREDLELSVIKEEVGDRFTWSELRLFKATL